MSTKFNDLFKSIDKSDTETFLSFLSNDATFIFGNLEPVEGKNNIRNFLNNFFKSIDHTEHSQIEK